MSKTNHILIESWQTTEPISSVLTDIANWQANLAHHGGRLIELRLEQQNDDVRKVMIEYAPETQRAYD